MPLTTEKIDHAQPGVTPGGRKTSKPYKMGDSGGLFLEIPPAGSKRWRWKYRFAGREKRLSLGLYPEISLLEAREKRDAFRALLAHGTDPSEHVKQQRAARRAEEARRLAATRFMLDSDGALSFCLGSRRLSLTSTETTELRAFLGATRAVCPKE
jgi:hypothetical protein